MTDIILNPTPSQKIALREVKAARREGRRPFILWYGGVRAGKSFGSVACLLEHAKGREHANYIIGGYSQRALYSNIAPIFEQLTTTCKVVGGAIRPRIEVGSNTFHIFGGGKFGDDRAVQGFTATGLFLDELELLEQNFVYQCEARVSVKGGLRIYTSNKASRWSWAKRAYYDRAVSGEIKALLLDTDTTENQHLDADYIEERKREFSGIHLDRFMNNEFADPFTPIYKPDITERALGDPKLVAIYELGNTRLHLPFYRSHKGWVIGKYLPDIPEGCTYLVNRNARLIANECKQLGAVRGYDDSYHPQRVELAKLAFDSGQLAVAYDAEINDWIQQYHQAGLYPSISIAVLEAVVERLGVQNDYPVGRQAS